MVGERPVDTDFRVQFFTGSSTYTLIPDSDLPGNAAGFSGQLIDLSTLDVTSYPAITAGLSLETSDTSETPTIEELAIYYRAVATPRGSVNIDITGGKIIGTELDLTPIPKVALSTASNGAGEATFSDVEFDTYTVSNLDDLTVLRACPELPLNHAAGIDSEQELVLDSTADDTLRVMVTTTGGTPLPGARVTLSRSGFSETLLTDSCGQVFFASGLTAASDYELTVSRTGYTSDTQDPYNLSGHSETSFILSES